MNISEPETQAMIQNLKDAGCDMQTIAAFVADITNKETAAGILLLRKHRALLLDDAHKIQKKIDCLDYLIYRIRQYAWR